MCRFPIEMTQFFCVFLFLFLFISKSTAPICLVAKTFPNHIYNNWVRFLLWFLFFFFFCDIFFRYYDPFYYNYRPGYPAIGHGMQGYGSQRENDDRNWYYQPDDRNRYSQYENRYIRLANSFSHFLTFTTSQSISNATITIYWRILTNISCIRLTSLFL